MRIVNHYGIFIIISSSIMINNNNLFNVKKNRIFSLSYDIRSQYRSIETRKLIQLQCVRRPTTKKSVE